MSLRLVKDDRGLVSLVLDFAPTYCSITMGQFAEFAPMVQTAIMAQIEEQVRDPATLLAAENKLQWELLGTVIDELTEIRDTASRLSEQDKARRIKRAAELRGQVGQWAGAGSPPVLGASSGVGQ